MQRKVTIEIRTHKHKTRLWMIIFIQQAGLSLTQRIRLLKSVLYAEQKNEYIRKNIWIVTRFNS